MSDARLPSPQVVAALREVGESLTKWRLLMNMPTSTLAARSGVSVRTVKRIENGESASFEAILALANELGLLSSITGSVNPWQNEYGRALADRHIPRRATGSPLGNE